MFSSLFYYFGLGDLLRECNELDAAEQHLLQGMALVKETLTVEPFVAVLGYTALARLLQAQGNSREALATLDAWRTWASSGTSLRIWEPRRRQYGRTSSWRRATWRQLSAGRTAVGYLPTMTTCVFPAKAST